ncbi:hypothetical protein FB451DRAFT_1411420 [Mycena latifolia]|nr:hypothetical protein FB451DRAFT_1411420 [Mycena latifolia]
MSGMLFANFNQDYSCVSVGTRKGYSITNCDPFGRVYTERRAHSIVEMLFCTSLIAIVGGPDTLSCSSRSSTPTSKTRAALLLGSSISSVLSLPFRSISGRPILSPHFY